jgi:hypothetical protein
VVKFSRQDISPTFVYVAFTHGTSATSTASGRQEYAFIRQGAQQGRSWLYQHWILFIAIHDDLNVTLGDKTLTRSDQHERQCQNHKAEHNYSKYDRGHSILGFVSVKLNS